MNNPPRPRRPQQQQQNPNNPIAPVSVILALIQQSKARYQTCSEMLRNVDEMIRREDMGFRQLDLEASQMAQLMMQQSGEADPSLHRLGESLQAAKRAGAFVRQNLMQARADLEGQLEVEKFLHGELMRWTRGQKPVQMAEPVNGNAPAMVPPAPAPNAQLGQGPVPPVQNAQLGQGPVPQNLGARAPAIQTQQQPPSYHVVPGYVVQQTPYGPDPNGAPPSYNAPPAQQPVQGGVPNHMFGPYPGQPMGPAFAPAPPESLPVTQLPVTQVPYDASQPASVQPPIMPPPVTAQQYASLEAARAAMPGPAAPVVQTPPVVQYASPEMAKSVVDASHANNVPAVSVPQTNVNGQVQKPVS